MAQTRVEVKMSNAGMRALYREVAKKIERVDASFRTRWEGKPASEILPQVAGAFGRIGVELPSVKRREYADAVSKSEPFVWVLG